MNYSPQISSFIGETYELLNQLRVKSLESYDSYIGKKYHYSIHNLLESDYTASFIQKQKEYFESGRGHSMHLKR